MSQPVYRICNLLEKTLQGVPIGTNLGLFQLQFALVSGRFLQSRGAVFPALDSIGLEADAVRRSSAALRKGRWQTQELLDNWQKIVQTEGHFKPHCHGGYRPVPCDLTGFRRPELKGNSIKHYVAEANKALPAIVIGIAVAVGSVADSRFALPRLLVRWEKNDTREADIQTRLIEQAGKTLAPDEVAIFDAGFSLAEVRAKTPRFLVRLAKNATVRRNFLPEYKGIGCHPKYGDIVRPLPRTRKIPKQKDEIIEESSNVIEESSNVIEAPSNLIESSEPDSIFKWSDDDVRLHAHVWKDVILPEEKPGAPGVTVVAIFDPRYKDPLLLATNLEITAEIIWRLYRDRWAVEHLPLAAKPMLGCDKAFVFGEESRLRLPELALLSGNLLSYVAATCSAVASGFWDRVCRATCGRLRRVLNRLNFSELPDVGGQLRKKASLTSHLVTGVEGHRRQKAHKVGQGVLQSA
jgi:hypothetical protein